MDPDIHLTRRNFMSTIILAIGGIISAGMGLPAIWYIVGPALKKSDTQDWIPLGSATKVEMGVPTLFKTTVQRQTGWIMNEQEISTYILTENGRDYIALSNICTHLGCRVRWISENDRFFCPCHNAVFDRQGNVVSGPPPRPLDRYQVKVEGNQLFILGG